MLYYKTQISSSIFYRKQFLFINTTIQSKFSCISHKIAYNVLRKTSFKTLKKKNHIYLTLITLIIKSFEIWKLQSFENTDLSEATTERIFAIKRKLQNNIITQFSRDKYDEIQIEIIRDNYFFCNSSSKSNCSLINTYSTRKIVH